jgi:hypothetical protein
MRGDAERVAGVIVEPADDLDVGVIGQPTVGEVGPPALVGLLGGTPDVGGFGPFLWCWGDVAGVAQMPTSQTRTRPLRTCPFDEIGEHDNALAALDAPCLLDPRAELGTRPESEVSYIFERSTPRGRVRSSFG